MAATDNNRYFIVVIDMSDLSPDELSRVINTTCMNFNCRLISIYTLPPGGEGKTDLQVIYGVYERR